jgi:hypothetical protein
MGMAGDLNSSICKEAKSRKIWKFKINFSGF